MKIVKAWAVVESDYGFPIPNIPHKIKSNKKIELLPSCIFKDKEQAELCKKHADNFCKAKDLPKELNVLPVEIKILGSEKV